jgi:hypothetical protein
MVTSLFLYIALLGTSPLTNNQAQAHEADTSTAPAIQTVADTTAPAQTSYRFIAMEGDALTYIVRRSIQLYAADHTLSIEPAQAVYAETNITQALGNGFLDIGQQVEVPFNLLDQYINSSKLLTTEQLTAWQQYLTNVSFEVSYINPLNTNNTAPSEVKDDTETETAPKPSDDEKPAQDTSAKETDFGLPRKSRSINVWLIAVIALGVISTLYFITISGRSKSQKNGKN